MVCNYMSFHVYSYVKFRNLFLHFFSAPDKELSLNKIEKGKKKVCKSYVPNITFFVQ